MSFLAESSLLRNHSQYRTIRGHRLRIVYIPCPSSTLPLLVFIHGLGGQVPSRKTKEMLFFLLTRIGRTMGSSIGLLFETSRRISIGYAWLRSKPSDFRVCLYGLLSYHRKKRRNTSLSFSWSSYRTCSLVQDVASLLASFSTARSIVLIAHSYGCAIASYLAALPEWQPVLRGLILISPKESMTDSQKRGQKLIQWIPDWLMDRGRRADRQGGLNSKSVTRFLRPDTDVQHKRKWVSSIRKYSSQAKCVNNRQLKWNLMSRTPVYKCFVTGLELPDQSTYAKIQTRVLMIGGTKVTYIQQRKVENVIKELLFSCRMALYLLRI